MDDSMASDPLIELLRLLGAGAAFTGPVLAQRLDVHPAVLEAMLETLAASGYIAQPASCAGGCHGCPSAASCGVVGGARIWDVTERGRRLLQGR